MSSEKWEYLVIHVNFEPNKDFKIESNSPKIASDKLQGSLSPEYLEKEFPEQFKKSSPPIHPTKQLQIFLNKCGKEGWKLTSTETVGGLLMFVFLREKRNERITETP